VSYALQSAGNKYDWIILDTLGNLVKKKERTISPFTSNWPTSGGMYKFENRIYNWNTYNDTVFSILPNLNYESSFLFSPGEHRVPRSEIKDILQVKFILIPTKFEKAVFYDSLFI
jgi:hypothetical protein